MSIDYTVTVKKSNDILTTLVIEYVTDFTLFSRMHQVIWSALKKHSLSPKNAISVSVQKKGKRVIIEVTATKFDLSDIITQDKPEKEQIIALLEKLDFCDKKIRSVYEISSGEWEIRLYEHYDPDESYSQMDHEYYVSQMIEDILGFKAHVSMY